MRCGLLCLHSKKAEGNGKLNIKKFSWPGDATDITGLLWVPAMQSCVVQTSACARSLSTLAACFLSRDVCMQAGKDRTGIIAALVLACSGASDVQIVEDYARCCQHTLLAAVLTFSPSRLIEVGKGRGIR